MATALSDDDQTLLASLLGNAVNPAAAPSTEFLEEDDKKRLYMVLFCLFFASLVSLICAWLRYGKDVADAFAAPTAQQARATMQSSENAHSKLH